ncbi:MAG: HU family DNA-binding protein [Pseudooceanicola sp.]
MDDTDKKAGTAPSADGEGAAKPASTLRDRAARAAPVPDIALVETHVPVLAKPELKKRELIDKVVALTGQKKRDVRPTLEAAFAVLGEALDDGRDLNLEPLGKVKVNRHRVLSDGRVFNTRIRRKTQPPSGT